MPTRTQVLTRIADFLTMRYNAFQQSEAYLQSIPIDKANAIVSAVGYYDKTKYEYTVKELSEALPNLLYSSIHWALYGAYGGDIKMQRHPAELLRRGIYIEFGKPASYRFEPSLITSKTVLASQTPTAPVVLPIQSPPGVVQQRIPEPVIVPAECTRKHMPRPALDGLLGMFGIGVDFSTEGTVLSKAIEKPESIVGIYPLSAVEVAHLREKFGDHYKVYEPLVVPEAVQS